MLIVSQITYSTVEVMAKTVANVRNLREATNVSVDAPPCVMSAMDVLPHDLPAY